MGICGAGIGGIATAIAVARAGARVTLLEQADEIAEVSLPALRSKNRGNGLTPLIADWSRHPDDAERIAAAAGMGRRQGHRQEHGRARELLLQAKRRDCRRIPVAGETGGRGRASLVSCASVYMASTCRLAEEQI